MTTISEQHSPAVLDRLKDFAALAKPRITLLVIITTAGGLWMAPSQLDLFRILVTIIGTVLVVIAANVLNCYLERDSDRFMARTKNRPLPGGRMSAQSALIFGLALAAVSVPALTFLVNPMTGLLAAIALVSYVWVYTPMKQRSPVALWVGSISGAMPPLMGWTAVTGTADWPGVVLFGILFLWQLPHFLAISVYRQREYTRAGIKTLPEMYGFGQTRWQMLFWTGMLVPVSLLLVPLGVAGWIYFGLAAVLGAGFLWYCVKGLSRTVKPARWARSVFLYSLIYLTLLFAALVVDAGPMVV